MIEKIKDEVKKLLLGENSGHDWEHTFRVYNNAMFLAEQDECATKEIVAISALLHECDDYKVFGQESSENLLNARRILKICGVEENNSQEIIEIISNLGYSKYITGTQKLNLNGQIVQDADMLDSLGTMGIIRTIVFNATKGTGKVFVRDIFPDENLTKEKYQNKVKKEETVINHLFEKMLKLKDIMYTKAGYEEACIRHQTIVDFLRAFFREQGLDEWSAYLDRCLKK